MKRAVIIVVGGALDHGNTVYITIQRTNPPNACTVTSGVSDNTTIAGT